MPADLNWKTHWEYISSRDTSPSEKSGLDSAMMTGIVDWLELAGLVNRKPNPFDRRRYCYLPNPKGSGAGFKDKH